MKKLFSLTLACALIAAFSTPAFAADMTWTGWIADENCAKNYSKSADAGHAGCAKACVSKGNRWALATQNGALILDVAPSEAENHLGHEVMVKGELDKSNNTIKVSSISKTN